MVAKPRPMNSGIPRILSLEVSSGELRRRGTGAHGSEGCPGHTRFIKTNATTWARL